VALQSGNCLGLLILPTRLRSIVRDRTCVETKIAAGDEDRRRIEPSRVLADMFDELDGLDQAVRDAGSVEKARKLIVPFFRHLAATEQ
jgi:hypothetical protein